ncbi:MAG: AGE family epimerase/isomerase [Rhodospirillales bacterium]|nr:AGE family epimerase/isomerase [Rhodospirillales bacterium]MCB9995272.1 AGE family epimerase/isomerase [Rhodospirillales bacterium]
MAGLHTTIEKLSFKLQQRWVPKWYEAFCDPAGGFYERLGHSFKPVMTGRKRLLTQCRQLAMYSHAGLQGRARDFTADLAARFDYMVRTYHVPKTGGWIYSVDDDGKVLDGRYDLYTQAFVIFALSQYYRVSGDETVRELSLETLRFVDKNFRKPDLPGLVEVLDEKLKPLDEVRRHESHMHLLEACLFAAESSSDMLYRQMADELADLFLNYLYDREANLLSEYFTDELKPKKQHGAIVVEPGHYCEWIWLLKKHAVLHGDPARYDDLCKPLLEWASVRGWDGTYGGIYDELDPDGAVIADTKRIWPLAEALKANALMLDSGVDKDAVKQRIHKMINVFDDHYMQERGFWTEWLRRDLTAETDYMPGTTPYHVYFGIMETREVVLARGKTRSISAGPQLLVYRLRRKVSDAVRAVRLGLKAF